MRNLLLILRSNSVCVLWAALFVGTLSTAQPRVSIVPRDGGLKRATERTRASLRTDISMVLVPVTVIDASDRPVLDLPRDGFRVFEDNVEQRIASFALEEGPVSLCFVFDASSSMKSRMMASTSAIQQFLAMTMPGDEFALVRFSDQAELLSDFTHDPDQILASIAGTQPAGWTSLHDAIFSAAQQMKRAHNVRKALVILTDGEDNNSRYTEKEVRSLVRESDVRVFSIGIFERPRLLEDLAADTGGHAFRVNKLKELPDVIDRLSRELRSEYMLGYVSNNPQNDGKFRKVRVELVQTLRRIPFSVYFRSGYYAPAD